MFNFAPSYGFRWICFLAGYCHAIELENGRLGRRKMFHRMHFYGMAWGSPPALEARRFDCASTVEAGSPYPEDVARLAVEKRKGIAVVAFLHVH